MDIFVFDNQLNKVALNEHSVLLIKEFNDLWKVERNKCKEDPDGKLRLKAYKEFTYIYLFLDWKSVYYQYLEQEKHEAAMIDSGLTEDDTKDELFKSAFEKYKEIQESDRILSLIKTAFRTLYKMQIFLDNIDFNNDVDETGRPLYKPADVIKDIASIAKMRNELLSLEVEHKKNLQAQSSVRGDNELGYMDA